MRTFPSAPSHLAYTHRDEHNHKQYVQEYLWYEWIDNCFLVAFMMEIMISVFIWGRAFPRSGWRCFDFFVITIGAFFQWVWQGKYQVLRLIRVFRIVKSFRMLASFRIIMTALTGCILPVLSALGILILVVTIYAVVAVSSYADQDPVRFGNLSRALFTVFQISTTEGWQVVAREQMELDGDDDEFNRTTAFFFISIVLLCGIVLTNGWDFCTNIRTYIHVYTYIRPSVRPSIHPSIHSFISTLARSSGRSKDAAKATAGTGQLLLSTG